jgi:molecular chaperone GrpE
VNTSGQTAGDPRSPDSQEQAPGGVPAEPTHADQPEQAAGGEDSVTAREAVAALKEVEDRFLRLAAEYDNYRKRTTREKAESFDRGGADFARHLFSTLDDLDRLLAADATTTEVGPFREGLELIVRKLTKELEAAGMEAIDPAGKPFDPSEHDAVALAVPQDPALDDTVANTLQKGYRFRGVVIRPAKVQVYSVDGAL